MLPASTQLQTHRSVELVLQVMLQVTHMGEQEDAWWVGSSLGLALSLISGRFPYHLCFELVQLLATAPATVSLRR